ncbi:MAG: hypothetical protein ACYDD4_11880 [Acidimicrobiales bacterium]
MTITNGKRITRDDLEAKFRQLSGEVDEQVEAKRPVVLANLAAGVVAVALVAYLLGRRAGTARSAVVEIKRL